MSYFPERCVGCGSCVEACPSKALLLTKQGVIRNRELCVVCGCCADACTTEATEKIGKKIAPHEIVEIVAGDNVFYDSSGGGVTISGGEPTFQADFLLEILQLMKDGGIHTALETCGYFEEKLVDKLPQLVDLFLFDIKHIEAETHKSFTGVSNARILSNFSNILSRIGSERIFPRIPVIPGFNADRDSLDQILAFLDETGHAGQVHLMPYNRMAKTKWEKIGRLSSYKDMGELSEGTLDEFMSRIERASFAPVCNS